jgi:hypothetical protein
MKTLNFISFRGNKNVSVTYQDNQRGLMLSWVGTQQENWVDSMSIIERNYILKQIIKITE